MERGAGQLDEGFQCELTPHHDGQPRIFLYIPYADAQFVNNDNYDDAASVLGYESVSTRVLVGLRRPDPWSLVTLVVIEARGRLHSLK